MILYLDTSALVKAYIHESSSDRVIDAIAGAEVLASHSIGFVEMRATIARLQREKKLNEKQFESIKQTFLADWENYLQVETTALIIQSAADFAEAFAMRAYDSAHLAAAHYLVKQSHQPLIFGCFDRKLNQAARILGLNLLET